MKTIKYEDLIENKKSLREYILSLCSEDKVFDGDLDLYDMELDELPDLSDITVTGYFCCSFNNLTNLEGCPEKVGGHFYCYSNNLISLEGSPEKVGGSFNCYYNKLTSLEGCPVEIGEGFFADDNFTEDDKKVAMENRKVLLSSSEGV